VYLGAANFKNNFAKTGFMPELHEIKRTLSRIEKLERDVSLKQLQINSLLAITQAINDNVAAADLFNMITAFGNVKPIWVLMKACWNMMSVLSWIAIVLPRDWKNPTIR
jgi:hypothetical protein